MWFNTVFFIPPTKNTISGEPFESNGKQFIISGEPLQLRTKSFTFSGIEL